jgi:hypothetical protein
MDTVPDHPQDERAYTYRPSQMGAPWRFHLTSDGLAWRCGRMSGHVLYGDMRRVRLSFKPVSTQSQRYIMEIWADGTPKLQAVSTSWKSMFEQERRDADYRAFVTELHRHLAQMPDAIRFERGRSPYFYWPGFAMFAAVALGFALMTVRALQTGELAGAAFIAAFLALFVWYGNNYFRRNRPGTYAPDALPDLLLPPKG